MGGAGITSSNSVRQKTNKHVSFWERIHPLFMDKKAIHSEQSYLVFLCCKWRTIWDGYDGQGITNQIIWWWHFSNKLPHSDTGKLVPQLYELGRSNTDQEHPYWRCTRRQQIYTRMKNTETRRLHSAGERTTMDQYDIFGGRCIIWICSAGSWQTLRYRRWREKDAQKWKTCTVKWGG